MDLSQYNLSNFYRGLDSIGVKLSDGQVGQFMDYYELLVEWNSFMNLTAITDFDEVCTKHFIDSLSLVKSLDIDSLSKSNSPLTIIDVGTGAGFPGLPLKICFPALNVTLLDSLGKRVKFLNEVISRLGLVDIRAVHGRAEDFAKDNIYRETFDICVSRAVANLSTLAEYCLPFVKIGGCFVSYKSEKVGDEIQAAHKAIEILGGNVVTQNEFLLPDSDIYRNLVKIDKIKPTPKKFPRKAGLPSREPLG
jgi:16S rRNA (guanine527-N7)-methyltransferase